mmetsp:Transcript_57622/g.115383  ORF Transcript_57622/g.115383 Transcript_57622/m.115383 type:complete len:519 (-) Transcript_57622:299-1855(-)
MDFEDPRSDGIYDDNYADVFDDPGDDTSLGHDELEYDDGKSLGANPYQAGERHGLSPSLPQHVEDGGPKASATANKERWEQRTIDSLNHAKALTKHALKSCVDNDSVHGHAKRSLHANTHTVSHTIKKKIGQTEDLIKALEDRIESVEDTMRQVGECLFQLQRAFRSKWSPLNVCERRLQLRDARPQQELIRDPCQEALERERQTLIESRQELADQIDSMKEMLITLDKVKGELIEDMQHKRHALRIDRSCLDPKKQSLSRTAQDRLVLPQLHEVVHYGGPLSPKEAESGTGHHHEENRQVNAKDLITKAVRCEEDAMKLCNESDAVMIHTKRECTRACTQAQSELGRRVEETTHYKKQLEAQIQETDETIAQTEMSLAKMKKKIEAHEQPLRALDKQFHARTGRTSREDIRDHVHDELEGHLDTVKKNVKNLTEKWQHTRDIVEQLRSTKQRLQEDYRCKCAALKIDDSCVKVTPKKAIELDRMDPRGGRCREPPLSARKKQRDYGGYEAMNAHAVA